METSSYWNITLDVSEPPTTTCHEQSNSNFLTTHDQVAVTSEREYSCLGSYSDDEKLQNFHCSHLKPHGKVPTGAHGHKPKL